MSQLVYLDQKDWIYLAQSYYGKNNNEQLKIVCNKVLEASEKGSHIFPISIIHQNETLTSLDRTRLKRLAEFMIKVSKGYCIAPYTSIIDAEIKRAVIGLCSGKKFPISRERIVGIGLEYMLGAKGTLVKTRPDAPDIPEETKKKILDITRSPETLLRTFMDEEVAKGTRKIRHDIEGSILNQLESIRLNDAKIKDKGLRRRVCAAKFFVSDIVDEMARTAVDLQIQHVFGFLLSELKGEEKIEKFFQSMPTAYTLFSLTRSRDNMLGRKIAENDLNDISALSMAIPHCDIVVTEKMWHTISIQNKLDKIYNTKIFPNVSYLSSLL